MNVAETVQKLGPWYQQINFDGVLTTESKISGYRLWNIIKQNYLPESLKNLRILDLGCNAGYFTVQSAVLGAEAIGVERSDVFFQQAQFTKSYFEKKLAKTLNVKFLQTDIGSLDFSSLGKFDYVLAIAVLYHIGKYKFGKYSPKALEEQEFVIGELTKISKNIIVRTRNHAANNVEHYSKIFSKFNFKPSNLIGQGRRSLILYK